LKSPTEIYEFLSAIISAAPYGIMAIDLQGELTLLNERALQYLEIDHQAKYMLEKSLLDYLDHLPELGDVMAKCLQYGREEFDLSIQSPTNRFILIRARHILNGMILTIEDTTAIKEMEMLTLNAMLQGQEKERRRWAQEIHDGIGPVLSAIKMNLDEVQEEVLDKSSERNRKHFGVVQDLLKSVTQDLRGISHDLMPSILEDFGLSLALENLCSQRQSEGGPVLQCVFTGEIQRLPPPIELALFRVVQELLHNALKYAQATRVVVQFIQHRESIVLMVEDDGRGFELNKVGSRQGIGLRNIRTRIQSIKGTFSLESQPGDGTLVTIEIPLLPTKPR
jgi:signal transduction histidine kinase